jgi:hypothetical protein
VFGDCSTLLKGAPVIFGKGANNLLLGVPQGVNERIGQRGRCHDLEPSARSVVAITAETAVIESRAGARLAYLRRSMAGPVIWDLIP